MFYNMLLVLLQVMSLMCKIFETVHKEHHKGNIQQLKKAKMVSQKEDTESAVFESVHSKDNSHSRAVRFQCHSSPHNTRCIHSDLQIMSSMSW